jgi:dihydroorotate dehydrogenase electron transfer subunit
MKKEIIEAEIVRNTEIAKGVYQMTILCGDVLSAANPGQFINLYLNDKSMLLPRPFSLCRKEQEKAVVVYPGDGQRNPVNFRDTGRETAPDQSSPWQRI